ncbi:hypothetical protein [Winogradskyella sp. PG-2]|uniref:hypothetical protein n=1 Tax=Winogradskyella sp. PG-2 TaxID=754409 RepID=UPI00045883C0|nr:hypothetical protein [Winogradskyella sp. PG-2]BAO76350.1 hypothetical protein WPG_2120 [Winogradskyella sp. PG-2]
MLNFRTLIQNEYENAYRISLKRQFSEPKIYTAKGNLKKRWYVYFSYRDDTTGYLTKQTPFYGNANTYKTKEERLVVLNIYKRIILKYLKAGFNPYEDNTNRLKALNSTKANLVIDQPISLAKKNFDVQIMGAAIIDEEATSVTEAFKFVLDEKEKEQKVSSFRSFSSHIRVFERWLIKNKPTKNLIKDLTRSDINTFLNHIL